MNIDNIFEKVKSRVNIADVVERFGVKLNRSDKGLCPFHDEKTPSFSVKKSDNIFKCFGCDESGDAVHFVAKLKGIEPLEAAQLLEEIYGIDQTAWGGKMQVDTKPDSGTAPPQAANAAVKRTKLKRILKSIRRMCF